MLSTERDRQTNQRYQKHNLLCQGGNNSCQISKCIVNQPKRDLPNIMVSDMLKYVYLLESFFAEMVCTNCHNVLYVPFFINKKKELAKGKKFITFFENISFAHGYSLFSCQKRYG